MVLKNLCLMDVVRVYIRAIKVKVLTLPIFVPLAKFRGSELMGRNTKTEVVRTSGGQEKMESGGR